MQTTRFSLALLSALTIAAAPACGVDPAEADATDAGCTVTDLGDGTSAIRCGDGLELVVSNGKAGATGKDGADGAKGQDGKDGEDGKEVAPCTIAENADGTHTLTCGGQSVVVGGPCEGGFPGDVWVVDPDAPDDPDYSLTLFRVTTCTWVRGFVVVGDYSGKELPKALARITEIDDSLLIGDVGDGNEALESVSFPALKRVGGAVHISDNDALTEVGDFPALEEVGEYIWIRLNPELRKIGSFPALKSTTEIDIRSNPELETIGSFPALQSAMHIEFRDNAKLETIGSFDELTEVDTLRWLRVDSVTDMGAFPKLERAAELELGRTAVTALADFPMLEEIVGSEEYVLLIWGNAKLASIDGLKQLKTVVGGVVVAENPALPHDDVEALFNGVDVSGDKDFCDNKGGGPLC